MKTLLALAMALLLSSTAMAQESDPFIPVVIYHIFDENAPPSRENIKLKDFEEHIKWLHQEGYTTMTMQEVTTALNGRTRMPKKAIAITLDDGWKTQLDAVKVIRKYDMAATAFLLTSTFDYQAYVSVEDIKWLASQKYIEIGAHTHTHFMLWADNMDSAPTQTMVYEMATSKLLLEDIIGRPVRSFAWPFGYVRSDAEKYLPKLGYTSAVQVSAEINNTRESTSPFQVRRINIDGRCTLDQFRQVVSTGKYVKCD